VGLAGCDGLGGVGWAGGVGWVGWACAGCRGRCFGPRGVAANAPCGRGDGSPPGRAVRAGWLLRGLTVALNGGGVLPHTTSPQPPTPGRPDWPARIMITTPANTTIAAPAAATAYRGCRASAVRHRPRLVARWRPALPMSHLCWPALGITACPQKTSACIPHATKAGSANVAMTKPAEPRARRCRPGRRPSAQGIRSPAGLGAAPASGCPNGPARPDEAYTLYRDAAYPGERRRHRLGGAAAAGQARRAQLSAHPVVAVMHDFLWV
jgi:hypothetical protein